MGDKVEKITKGGPHPEQLNKEVPKPLTKEEATKVVLTMRAAPLKNMTHAEDVDKLCARVIEIAGLETNG